MHIKYIYLEGFRIEIFITKTVNTGWITYLIATTMQEFVF